MFKILLGMSSLVGIFFLLSCQHLAPAPMKESQTIPPDEITEPALSPAETPPYSSSTKSTLSITSLPTDALTYAESPTPMPTLAESPTPTTPPVETSTRKNAAIPTNGPTQAPARLQTGDDGSLPNSGISVIVEGYGSMINGDVAGARDAAIADARRKAIETVAGVEITAYSKMVKELLSEDVVETLTKGVITRFFIIEEKERADGIYHVLAEATVETDRLAGILSHYTPKKRVLVWIYIDDRAGASRSRNIENELVRALQNDGYEIIDPEYLCMTGSDFLLKKAHQGELSALRRLGLRYGARLIVTGNADLFQPCEKALFYTCRAGGVVKLYDVEKSKMMGSLQSKDEVIGFGKTSELARRDAELQMGSEWSDSLLAMLAPDEVQHFDLRIRGLKTRDDLRRLRNAIYEIRFVSSVSAGETEFSGWLTKMSVKFQCDPQTFVRELSRLDGIYIKQVQSDEIEMSYE